MYRECKIVSSFFESNSVIETYASRNNLKNTFANNRREYVDHRLRVLRVARIATRECTRLFKKWMQFSVSRFIVWKIHETLSCLIRTYWIKYNLERKKSHVCSSESIEVQNLFDRQKKEEKIAKKQRESSNEPSNRFKCQMLLKSRVNAPGEYRQRRARGQRTP